MIQAVRGTKDILPEAIGHWYFIEQTARKVANSFAYYEMRTPTFEKTEVFSRGVGEATDIVNKEMYTFSDKGGEMLTLRPENTAAIVRSVIQNSLTQVLSVTRLWYLGPFYRYERPQKGRLRQFHQFGAECIGSPYPESDAENILLAHEFIKALGISDYKLMLNSLGNEASRASYREELVKFLMENKESLSEESKGRMEINPLRVLDSKDERDQAVIANAPNILDYLDEESNAHFNRVKHILDSMGVQYAITPRLVRGLDYYSHTVFEFQSSALGSQDAFGGGGRYNTLFTQLGGKETPAVGFAMGVERLLLILESLGKLPEKASEADVFVICGKPEYLDFAMQTAQVFRDKGLRTVTEVQERSFKAQMREANKFGVRYAAIIGDDEYTNKQVSVKDMTNSEQKLMSLEEIAAM